MKDGSEGGDALRVEIVLLEHAVGPPVYATDGAAGADLRAALNEGERVTIDPGARTAVPTGLQIALPPGYEAQIRPRSGLARKHGVTCLNAPGTIDADYRGEILVLLINQGQTAFTISRGKRIAQMVIAPVARARFEATAPVEDVARAVRGARGFGSTGD